MIFSESREFMGPASELAEMGRNGGKSDRQVALEDVYRSLRGLLEQAKAGNDDGMRSLLTGYSKRAAHWSPTNWMLLLSQRPNLVEPVTIREMRALGHQMRPGVKPAGLLIPVSVKDTMPLEVGGERNVVRMESAGKRDVSRIYFAFKRCVLDLGNDTEGPEVSLPPKNDASKTAFVARAEKVAYETLRAEPPAQVESLGTLDRAGIAVQLAFARANRSGETPPRILELAAFLTLRSEGFSHPAPDLAAWTDPKHLLGDLNAASKYVRRFAEAIKRVAQEEAQHTNQAVDRHVLTVTDLALQAETGDVASLAPLSSLWETTEDEEVATEEWEANESQQEPPTAENRRASLTY